MVYSLSDVTRITNFEFYFTDAPCSKEASIFSNGRNAVSITIEFDAFGGLSGDRPIRLRKIDLMRHVRLYCDGKDLVCDAGSESQWVHCTSTPGDFCGAFTYDEAHMEADVLPGTMRSSSKNVCTLYIRGKEGAEGEHKLFAGLDGLNRGYFLGRDDIKHDECFRENILRVVCLSSIDYSDPCHWIIPRSGEEDYHLQVMVNTVSVTEVNGDIINRTHYDGMSRYGKVLIRSRFYEALSIPIVSWRVLEDRSEKGRDEKVSMSALYGRCNAMLFRADHGTDINAFWIEPRSLSANQRIGFMPAHDWKFKISNGDAYFNIGYDDDRHSIIPEPSDKRGISVCLWNLHWHSGEVDSGQCNIVMSTHVEVVDAYGNSGTVCVNFSHSAWLPHLTGKLAS